jgi:hypothetical protein
MLNKKAEVKGLKVVATKEVREVKDFVYVCSPVSGKRYRFYYKSFAKFVVKGAVVAAVAVTAASLFLNAFLNAWDAEYEERMERQEQYLQEVEENQFQQPDSISSDAFNIIYGEGGEK